MTRVDSPVPLMHRDPNQIIGSLILILITPKERTLRFAWNFGFCGRNSYSIIYSCWRLGVVILPIWRVHFRPVFPARSGRWAPTILERSLGGHLKKELKGLQVLLNLCQGLPFSNSFSSRRERLVGLMVSRLQIERSWFESWWGTLCCVFGQDTQLSQWLSPTWCGNGYRGIKLRCVKLRWTSIPSSGSTNTPSRFILRKPEWLVRRLYLFK